MDINFLRDWDLPGDVMQITVAVEDLLSESVAHRLLRDYAPNLQPTRTEGLTGYGQLKARFTSFSKMAHYREPVLLITDLDNPKSCPLALIQEWRQRLPAEPNLLFRVAVVEIESWLIADRPGISQWLSIADWHVPRRPETLLHPKESLVGLAGAAGNARFGKPSCPGLAAPAKWGRVTMTHWAISH